MRQAVFQLSTGRGVWCPSDRLSVTLFVFQFDTHRGVGCEGENPEKEKVLSVHRARACFHEYMNEPDVTLSHRVSV